MGFKAEERNDALHVCVGGGKCHQNSIDGEGHNHCLDAEPAAGDDPPDQGRDVGAEKPETRPQKYREGYTVLGPGKGIQDHGEQNDHIAQKNGEHGREPVKTGCDHAGREHPGGYADAHAHPHGEILIVAPGSLFQFNRRQVPVVELAAGKLLSQLKSAVNLSDDVHVLSSLLLFLLGKCNLGIFRNCY